MQHHTLPILLGQQLVQSHFLEWGEPENPDVVLCVHGLTRNCRDFDELAQSLSEHYRVICLDVVGRGQSSWLKEPDMYSYPIYLQQIEAVISHLQIKQMHWIGTSMGGILGMLFASKPLSPIRRLVLSDVGPVIPLAAIQYIAAYLKSTPTFTDRSDIERYLRGIHEGFGRLTDQQWRTMAIHSSRQQKGQWSLHYDPNIAQAFSSITQDVDLSPYWQQVHCPTLVLRGAESPLLTEAIALEMKLRPNVQLQEFANVGHAPMMMSTDQIQMVQTFLTENSRPFEH